MFDIALKLNIFITFKSTTPAKALILLLLKKLISWFKLISPNSPNGLLLNNFFFLLMINFFYELLYYHLIDF